MGETFTAGINPGGLTDVKEIRILLCHMLSVVSGGMSFEEMMDVVLSNGIMNYFEFADAVSELCESGCLAAERTETGIKVYDVTDAGRDAAKTLLGTLPFSVVEKTEKAAAEKVSRRRLEKENTVKISRTSDGYLVHMAVTDIGTDLMELSLFMPIEAQAVKVKEKFLKNPAGTYTEILASLAGNI